MAEAAETSRRGSAKEYYDRVTHLVETTQVSAADAAKSVAEDLGKTESTVMAAYYRHTRKLKGDSGTSSGRGGSRRRNAKTVDGYEVPPLR